MFIYSVFQSFLRDKVTPKYVYSMMNDEHRNTACTIVLLLFYHIMCFGSLMRQLLSEFYFLLRS